MSPSSIPPDIRPVLLMEDDGLFSHTSGTVLNVDMCFSLVVFLFLTEQPLRYCIVQRWRILPPSVCLTRFSTIFSPSSKFLICIKSVWTIDQAFFSHVSLGPQLGALRIKIVLSASKSKSLLPFIFHDLQRPAINHRIVCC